MIVIYAFIIAMLACDLVETDWANVPTIDRVIHLALIAVGVFGCGWGIAFDLFGP